MEGWVGIFLKRQIHVPSESIVIPTRDSRNQIIGIDDIEDAF